MKILVQWATAVARDFLEVDSSAWRGLAKRPVPAPLALGGEDDQVGWVNALNVQGVEFTGYDHYAVEDLTDGSGGIRVTVWNDDPDDQDLAKVRLIRPDHPPFALGFYGQVWTFRPLAPDPLFNGAYNTRQTMEYFAERNKPVWDHLGDTVKRNWTQLPTPPEDAVRHGTWVSVDRMQALLSAKTPHGWREWTDGLPPQEIANGQLRDQRPLGRYNVPTGTRTFYWRDTDEAVPYVAATHEDQLNETAGGSAQSESVSVPFGTDSHLYFAATTPANVPNDADWPNGTYRCQMDATTVGSNISFGVGKTTGGTGNGFLRIASDGASVLENGGAQAEGAFTTTGLKLGTLAWNPAAGAAGDRWGISIRVRNAATMNAAQTLTLRVNTADSFTDGPWSAAAAASLIYANPHPLQAALVR